MSMYGRMKLGCKQGKKRFQHKLIKLISIYISKRLERDVYTDKNIKLM